MKQVGSKFLARNYLTKIWEIHVEITMATKKQLITTRKKCRITRVSLVANCYLDINIVHRVELYG